MSERFINNYYNQLHKIKQFGGNFTKTRFRGRLLPCSTAKKFNNYRFNDYKDQMIEMFERVCTISV